MVFAHGSRVVEANQAVRDVAAEAAEQCGAVLWDVAFLELAQPDLLATARCLRERGASRILVVPYFLTMGIHLKRDLPELAEQVRKELPDVTVELAPPLDGHPALAEILADRARDALAT